MKWGTVSVSVRVLTGVNCCVLLAVDMMMTGGQGCQQPGPNIPNSSWPGKDGPVPIPSMNPDKVTTR